MSRAHRMEDVVADRVEGRCRRGTKLHAADAGREAGSTDVHLRPSRRRSGGGADATDGWGGYDGRGVGELIRGSYRACPRGVGDADIHRAPRGPRRSRDLDDIVRANGPNAADGSASKG